MPALLHRVDFLVRLEGVGQVARILALQERKACAGNCGCTASAIELRRPRAKTSCGGFGSPGFSAGKDPPAGGVNIQIDGQRRRALAGRAGLRFRRRARRRRRRADIDEERAGAVEHECLSGWRLRSSLVPSDSVGCRPGKPWMMVSTRRGRIGGARIEAEDRVGGAGVDAAVDADAEAERKIEPAQQHLDALPCGRRGSSSSSRPCSRPQPPMSATTNKRVSGTCTMVRGKISPSSSAGDEAGAIARLHADAQFWKRAACFARARGCASGLRERRRRHAARPG